MLNLIDKFKKLFTSSASHEQSSNDDAAKDITTAVETAKPTLEQKPAPDWQKISYDILKFWLTSEMFSQENYYPDAKKDHDKFTKTALKYSPADKAKAIKNFLVLNLPTCIQAKPTVEEQIDVLLKKTAQAVGCKSWGDLTFYVGKIRREDCISKFAELMAQKDAKIQELMDARIEESHDELAWFTFQLDPQGSYKEGSFSLSPNLWLITKLSQNKNFDISNLDKKQYDEDNNYLQRILAPKDVKENDPAENQAAETTEETMEAADSFPVFAEDAIDEKRIQKVCQEVYEKFVQPALEASYKSYLDEYNKYAYDVYCGISYKLYADSTPVEDDNNYMPLLNSFFCDDINLVMKYLTNNNVSTQDLVDYITSAYSEMINTHEHEKRSDVKRIDIVNAEDDELLKYLQYILDVAKAPLGKWPSEFSPALTQQIAINNMVSIIERQQDFRGKNIFSVNGPPGTGKTTLLKEIIVHCIVEKANLLCQFQNPSDAFRKSRLLEVYGRQKMGSCYVFTPQADQINNYSILVTSCNNTAVENISKELPQQSKLLGDVKDETIKGLFSIAQDVENSQAVNQAAKQETPTGTDVKDIYFTNEAVNLFDLKDSKGNPDIWGLVAAPLGKKSNINNFIYKALFKIIYRKDKENNSSQEYTEAVEAYTMQREKVLTLRSELLTCCEKAKILTSDASPDEKAKAAAYLAAFKQKHSKVIYVDEKFVKEVKLPFKPEGDEFYKGA